MKKLFLTSDTHGIAVLPSAGYDLSIHVGDFLDAFVQSRELYAQSIAAARQFDVVVPGNHEWIVLQQARRHHRKMGPNIVSEENMGWLARLCAQPEQIITIEQVQFRISHYLMVDKRYIAAAPLSKPLESDAIRLLAARGIRAVLFGHNHRLEHLVIDGCHSINPGWGERGQYASVTIDGDQIEVALKSTDCIENHINSPRQTR